MFGEVVGVASGVCNCVCDPQVNILYSKVDQGRGRNCIHRMILAELPGDVHEEL